MPNLIVFTDLDGTLLDSVTYSIAEAQKGLDLCQRLDIPVVSVTSKTLAECQVLVRDLGLASMVIFENGGGFFGSDQKITSIGWDYARIRSFFKELQKIFTVRGFGDMSVEEVATRTGLHLEAAALAKNRRFTEPFVFEETHVENLIGHVEKKGLKIEIGNRFFHLMSGEQSKGIAIRAFIRLLEARELRQYTSIGVGDSPNDLSMLQETDYPIFVGNPDRLPLIQTISKLRIPHSKGPAGWTEGVCEVLCELGFKTNK